MVLTGPKARLALQAIPLVALLGIFLVTPALLILAEAVFPPGAATAAGAAGTAGGAVNRHFTLSLFVTLFHNPYLLRALWNSILIGLGATALSALLAVPFAVLLGRYRFPGRALVKSAVMLPLLLPPFAGTLAVKQLLGRYGSINLLLQDLHWIKSPIDWLGAGMIGVILLSGLHLFPILYFSLVNHFEALNGDSEDAALGFGGKTLRYYRKILWPEIRPGLLSGMALVFVWAFTDLGTPLLMEFRQVLSYQAFSMVTDLEGNPMGYALAAVMTAVGLAGYWLSQALARAAAGTSGKGFRPAAPKTLGRVPGIVAVTLLATVLVAAALPIVFLILLALAGPWFLSPFPATLTDAHFAQLLHHRITRGSIQTSLFLSSLAVLVDFVLGWWLARLVHTTRGWLARLLETLAMAPLALPGIVLAFGYVSMFSGTPLDPAGNPLPLLIMAYALRRLPFAFRSLLGGYRAMPARVDEAAQTLGQGFWGRVVGIHLPLLTPYALASGLLVFAFSMLEVSDSLVLAMKEFYFPITKAMYFLTSRAGDGNNLAAALAVIGMGILAAAIFAANRLVGKKFGEMFRGP